MRLEDELNGIGQTSLVVVAIAFLALLVFVAVVLGTIIVWAIEQA